jgi:multiple sugar transport system ATP-binding protein
MAQVRLKGVRKAFGEVEVLRDIDLAVEDGEFAVFVGPSGCGKSTLLRVIAGLEDITAGDLTIAGERMNDVPPSERGVAMVFQSYALYPHMNLYENMAFGLRLARVPKAEIDAAVRRAAKVLHIGHLLDRKPRALSGGQRQRVAIGRAIVRTPRVFLFDEPLSNLDAALRVRMRVEFAKLHEQLKTTMIYVTHDQVEAMTLADKIVVLSQGRVEQVGRPLELYHHPRNLFVAGFIGSPKMNFVAGRLVEVGPPAVAELEGGAVVRAAVDASGARPGDAVTLGVRPEHFAHGGGADGAIAGRVLLVEPLGEATFVYMEAAGSADGLTVRAHPQVDVEAGERFTVGVPADGCHLFDANGLAFRRLAGGGEARPRRAPRAPAAAAS